VQCAFEEVRGLSSREKNRNFLSNHENLDTHTFEKYQIRGKKKKGILLGYSLILCKSL